MKIETVTYTLDNHKRLGIQIKTEKDEIGWYIFFKLKHINNFFEKFNEIVDEDLQAEQIWAGPE